MSPEFRDYLLELLAPLEGVTARRMFGGGGLYLEDTMFAIVADDVLFLKVDETNQATSRPPAWGRSSIPGVARPSPCPTSPTVIVPSWGDG